VLPVAGDQFLDCARRPDRNPVVHAAAETVAFGREEQALGINHQKGGLLEVEWVMF
jgi:hypothetical protein